MVAQGTRVFGRVEDARPVEVLPGVVRRVVAVSERLMLVHWTLEAGATLPLHTHPHEQAGMLVGGRIRMVIGDADEEIEVGGTWVVPPMALHGATAIERSIVLDAFSPPREDYLT
ncbi:MAG: cupin domain-containing protein [Chloroflexi bacterium]|nr:cupin domain-containing protein [Chloroflexota bacterium]